jgi:peptide/nickel transport system permease protein
VRLATGDPAADLTSGSPSPSARGRLVLARLGHQKLAVVGMFGLALLVLFAFVGPALSPWAPTEKDFDAFLQPPSGEHWFGTDRIGQDVYAQTLRGLQRSLAIGFLAALLTTGTAALVGACAGYFGGWTDRVLMGLTDVLLVLPAFLVVALVSPTLRDRTWLLLVVLLAGMSWMISARVVRSLSRGLRQLPFVEAARFMGVPARVVIVRHLLPNMASVLIVDATINVAGAILAEATLSYFGFGVQPPELSLGTLIAAGTRSAITFPWLFVFSSGLLVLTVLAVSALGDGIRDALDPAQRSSEIALRSR